MRGPSRTDRVVIWVGSVSISIIIMGNLLGSFPDVRDAALNGILTFDALFFAVAVLAFDARNGLLADFNVKDVRAIVILTLISAFASILSLLWLQPDKVNGGYYIEATFGPGYGLTPLIAVGAVMMALTAYGFMLSFGVIGDLASHRKETAQPGSLNREDSQKT